MGKQKDWHFHPALPYAILCEGADGKNFIIYCLNSLIRRKLIPDNCFEAVDFGGNEDLSGKLKLVPMLSGYHDMKSILVVRDAERSAVQATASLRASFHEIFHVDVPDDGSFVTTDDGIRVGFYLFPGWRDSHFQDGTLEDLGNATLRDVDGEASADSLQNCADGYLDELLKVRHSFRTLHKNRLHAVFSGTDKFVGMKIGEAARAGAFDFSAEAMRGLNERICEMIRDV